MQSRHRQSSFSLLEVVVSAGVIVALLAILLPALSSARATSYQQRCLGNQVQLFAAWEGYLIDHDDEFPFVGVQPGWHYGGVRFSSVNPSPFLDFQRPLNPYLAGLRVNSTDEDLFCCPADRGVTDELQTVGTGSRTAYRSFGTSYRANATLLDARIAGVAAEARGVHRSEITAPPERLLLMGDPVWYEVTQRTGRLADWHERRGAGNVLFLDGSARFQVFTAGADPEVLVIEPAEKAKKQKAEKQNRSRRNATAG
jgi:prepilin-type processing-associated H-X9-DG protein